MTDPERVLRRTFGSSREELSRFLTETEVFCERWGASWKQSYFVNLTVEELCAVIIGKKASRKKKRIYSGYADSRSRMGISSCISGTVRSLLILFLWKGKS